MVAEVEVLRVFLRNRLASPLIFVGVRERGRDECLDYISMLLFGGALR